MSAFPEGEGSLPVHNMVQPECPLPVLRGSSHLHFPRGPAFSARRAGSAAAAWRRGRASWQPLSPAQYALRTSTSLQCCSFVVPGVNCRKPACPQVSYDELSYNGVGMGGFVVENTAAYISQVGGWLRMQQTMRILAGGGQREEQGSKGVRKQALGSAGLFLVCWQGVLPSPHGPLRVKAALAVRARSSRAGAGHPALRLRTRPPACLAETYPPFPTLPLLPPSYLDSARWMSTWGSSLCEKRSTLLHAASSPGRPRVRAPHGSTAV